MAFTLPLLLSAGVFLQTNEGLGELGVVRQPLQREAWLSLLTLHKWKQMEGKSKLYRTKEEKLSCRREQIWQRTRVMKADELKAKRGGSRG